MSDNAANEEYAHGHGAASEHMASRTAQTYAAFFLPHLRSGMRLLDAGCGPGTITLGLAGAVAPGEVVGIDISETEIVRARTAAEDAGIANARFEVGDAYELPFDDESLDAVFSHAMLEHLRRPLDALKEIHRVLRTGGVIGLRASTADGPILGPMTSALELSGRLFPELLRHAGWDPEFAGKQLRLVSEAGFSNPRFSASVNVVDPFAAGPMGRRYWEEPARVQMAIELGLADRDAIEAIPGAWDEWTQDPAACGVIPWLEAVAWKG